MVKQFDKSLSRSGYRATFSLVTMASIVKRETAVPEERPLVAGVYYNRLEKRMALDADPSVIYANSGRLIQGGIAPRRHVFKSAYNTYRNPGLPPGPIANPGRGSLEAAMHPTRLSTYFRERL